MMYEPESHYHTPPLAPRLRGERCYEEMVAVSKLQVVNFFPKKELNDGSDQEEL
jgi:hypothetical protein